VPMNVGGEWGTAPRSNSAQLGHKETQLCLRIFQNWLHRMVYTEGKEVTPAKIITLLTLRPF